MASAIRKWSTCDLGAYLQWLKDELKSITLNYCASGAEVYELSSFILKKIEQTISEQSQQMKE